MHLLALGLIEAILLVPPALCVKGDPPIQKRIDAVSSIHNVSDKLLLVDLKTFVSDHRPGLRMDKRYARPTYFDPKGNDLKNKAIDLMKQAIYATQMRIREIDFVIQRYKNNLPFQMAFLFYRLEQLIIDMRRIYTLALKNREKRPMNMHIIWYEHMAKKYIDVIYIVQFVIETHEVAMKEFDKLMGPKGMR